MELRVILLALCCVALVMGQQALVEEEASAFPSSSSMDEVFSDVVERPRARSVEDSAETGEPDSAKIAKGSQPPADQPTTPATPATPATDQPTDQPATDQPATTQPATDPPTTPTTPATDQPTDQPATDQPATTQPATDPPTTPTTPATDQPTDQPATDQPATTQPATDQPTVQPPTDPAGGPAGESLTGEQPGGPAEGLTGGQPGGPAEGLTGEQPGEQPGGGDMGGTSLRSSLDEMLYGIKEGARRSDNPYTLGMQPPDPNGQDPASWSTMWEIKDKGMNSKWRLPGEDHIMHGIDACTMLEAPFKIFRFTYGRLNMIEDLLANKKFFVADQLGAVAYPRCDYSVDVKIYEDSTKYRSSEGSNFDLNLSGSTGTSVEAGNDAIGSIGVKNCLKGEAGYKESVSMTNERFRSGKDKLSVAEVRCFTAIAEPEDFTIFHNAEEILQILDPYFVSMLYELNRLDQAENSEKSVQTAVQIVKQFGTHYYERAMIGGRLRQFMKFRERGRNSLDTYGMSQAASLSLSYSVGASASAKDPRTGTTVGASRDTSVGGSTNMGSTQDAETTAAMSSVEQSSRVLVEGGAPGSFSGGEGIDSFAKWAQTVDDNPVIIAGELRPISTILKQVVPLFEQLRLKFEGGSASAASAGAGEGGTENKPPPGLPGGLWGTFLKALKSGFFKRDLGSLWDKAVRLYGEQCGAKQDLGASTSLTDSDADADFISSRDTCDTSSLQWDIDYDEDGGDAGDGPWHVQVDISFCGAEAEHHTVDKEIAKGDLKHGNSLVGGGRFITSPLHMELKGTEVKCVQARVKLTERSSGLFDATNKGESEWMECRPGSVKCGEAFESWCQIPVTIDRGFLASDAKLTFKYRLATVVA
eukprot:TRINITY_DN88_c0_g1_i2.p1 TRINITY_DN88_c0_g1~~TRINITY_DN88_c0_g1_i2.p1  ORF type:complete len:873 (-),score=184.38 TRINITY_DN88_c0_g1_i2:93-2711(-)